MKSMIERTEIAELIKILGDNSPIGVCIIQEGKFCYINPAFLLFTSYSADKLEGRDALDIVVPEDRKMANENAIKMLKGERSSPSQLRVACGDGSIRWVMETVTSIQYHGRRATLGYFMDITERKQAEEALRESAERYRTILEETGDGYFETDLAGKFTFVNDAQARLLGYSREELIGATYRDFTPEEDVKAVFKAYKRMYKTGEPLRNFVDEVIRKDGSHGFAETSAFPIRNDKGEIIGFRGVRRDITERKQAEEALKQSRQILESVLESAPDGVFLTDLKGTFLYGNQKAEEIVGYSRNELIGNSFLNLSLLPEEQLEKAAELLECNIRGQSTGPDELQLIRKNSTRVWTEINTSVIQRGEETIVIGFVRDITERKEMEEALRQSEENYRTLFDSAVVGTIVVDADTMKVVTGNQAAARIFGFSSAEELIGIDTLAFVPPEDKESVRELMMNELFEQDLRRTRELRVMTKNGREIWISGGGARIMHGGKLAGLASFTDITERKQAEGELELRAQILDGATDSIFLHDFDGNFVYVNEAACRTHGYSREEFMKMKLHQIIAPERVSRLDSQFKEMLEKGEVIFESAHLRKDGSIMPAEVHGRTIESGGRKLLLTVIRDITVRKEMEEAIKHAAEEWRGTFDSISDAISIHDREFRILRANKAFSDIFHLKPRQIIGKHCYELHKGGKPRSGCPQEQTLATEKPAVTEFYEFHLGKFLLESTSPIFNEKGEVVGIVHVTRDVTAQKQQNERLMMTDRLASIGELAAGAAHEINNPLTSIIGFSQLLMEKDIPDDIRQDLTFIHNEAQRAAGVTKNLLAFAGKHQPVKQLNQINTIIKDVLKLRVYEHKIKDIEVDKQLASDLPESMVDYFQMQQVFFNIVINAEYFMTEAHDRGTLTITTEKQNGTVRISFADDGPGIPPEKLSQIFNPFFTTKETGKGTGLGLSICHGVVSEHGGKIYARSQPGEGATIFVELPINGNHIEGML